MTGRAGSPARSSSAHTRTRHPGGSQTTPPATHTTSPSTVGRGAVLGQSTMPSGKLPEDAAGSTDIPETHRRAPASFQSCSSTRRRGGTGPGAASSTSRSLGTAGLAFFRDMHRGGRGTPLGVKKRRRHHGRGRPPRGTGGRDWPGSRQRGAHRRGPGRVRGAAGPDRWRWHHTIARIPPSQSRGELVSHRRHALYPVPAPCAGQAGGTAP